MFIFRIESDLYENLLWYFSLLKNIFHMYIFKQELHMFLIHINISTFYFSHFKNFARLLIPQKFFITVMDPTLYSTHILPSYFLIKFINNVYKLWKSLKKKN